MEMRLMIFIFISFALKYLAEAAVDCGGCFKPPDFTSPYTIMEAQTGQSEAIVEHGLNEVPIKVDVQVRAINITDHVFPGLGSAQRDDDQPGPYGGVVYKYNKISVVLYVPNKNDGSSSGTIIYTGNDTWNGPYHETEDRAEVRAKVWKNCSFPQPQFDSDWFPMAVNNGTKSFKEIAHGLGTYPEYVSVQIKDKNSAWYSDGIGSVMTVQALDQQSAWGGVIYGFNDSHVRIWVPGYDSGSLFSTADGWGRGSKEVWNEGSIRVRVWSHFKGDAIYSDTKSLVNTIRKKRSHHLSTRSGNSLDIDTGMIYVTVKAIDGNNDGFSFPGMGAVQNADPTESFGGLVYSYGPRVIHVWQHLNHAEGYLIYINQNWGGGLMSQKSKNASMTVRFWEPYVGRCPTSPVDHAVTVHVDNGNPTTSPSRPGSTATINHTVTLHTSTASPTASQSSVHLQTTEVQSTKSTKSTASTLLPAYTEKESQSMSGAVLGIIIGACLIVAGGIATGIICALCKKNKRQVDDKNSMNG